MGVRACVRICVYVYAHLCNVCVWGAGEGGGGALCARSYTYMLLWIRICVYVCTHLCNVCVWGAGEGAGVVRAFVYIHVTMDVCIY